MKLLVWNLNGATSTSKTWDYILEANPDIALLQEVGQIPAVVQSNYSIVSKNAARKNGENQRFSTVVMTKGTIEAAVLTSSQKWVSEQLELYQGNLVAAKITVDEKEYNVVSTYSPAWEIDSTNLVNDELSEVRLQANNKVFLTEVLWSGLKHSMDNVASWIIGGDFNSSETFDKDWQDKQGVRYGLRSAGNREIIDRMYNLGLKEVLRESKKMIIPTYKSVRSDELIHQMDHLYINQDMLKSLETCCVGDSDLVLVEKMSDHLPIIASFNT